MQERSIRVFYHVSMMNHYLDVVKEQMDLMVDSGLYDVAESISVGCNGDSAGDLTNLLSKYPKAKIQAYSNDVKSFEFVTLRLIEEQKGDYFGLYFHTKGVSFPSHPGGKVWREYMNHYNIVEWRRCVDKLKTHDTCGVKFLNSKMPPVYKPHYSGNFFWFTSDYANKLPRIDSLNKTDRFQAEFWIGMSNPNASSLCQKFVDYNTKKFTVSKGNVYIHTLAYNLPNIVDRCVKDLYAKNNDFEHYIIDLGFPVEDDTIPNDIRYVKTKNKKKLIALSKDVGSNFLEFSNVGVSQNWQQFIDYIMPDDDDVIIGADPDEQVLDSGWVDAMRKVFEGDDKIAVVSLLQKEVEPIVNRIPKTELIINGVRVWYMSKSINWALIGIKGSFLNKIGNIPFPPKAPKYGWLEHEMYPLIKNNGFKWVILPDYRVHHMDYPSDEGMSKLYRGWKDQIIHRINEHGQISFDEYLIKLKNKELVCEYL